LEIGVRKVLGAEKMALIRQFLFEAILLSLIAFIIAIGLTFLLMSLFEQAADKDFSFTANQYLGLLLAFLIVSLLQE
jgi:putative ABC transport system permease protein